MRGGLLPALSSMRDRRGVGAVGSRLGGFPDKQATVPHTGPGPRLPFAGPSPLLAAAAAAASFLLPTCRAAAAARREPGPRGGPGRGGPGRGTGRGERGEVRRGGCSDRPAAGGTRTRGVLRGGGCQPDPPFLPNPQTAPPAPGLGRGGSGEGRPEGWGGAETGGRWDRQTDRHAGGGRIVLASPLPRPSPPLLGKDSLGTPHPRSPPRERGDRRRRRPAGAAPGRQVSGRERRSGDGAGGLGRGGSAAARVPHPAAAQPGHPSERRPLSPAAAAPVTGASPGAAGCPDPFATATGGREGGARCRPTPPQPQPSSCGV